MRTSSSRAQDPDDLISCEKMDTGENFLAKSREENWEFSHVEKAKWATFNLCYTVHKQLVPAQFTKQFEGD
ncbi:hypothetical protein niasHT_021811 [Heterodera trifolii]|uniref:CBP/p300-type HAT domain-containing protein n=1 Tax=Heterodera trifolii TaxID=157864 RepID=A0ABD2J8R9_9BILA